MATSSTMTVYGTSPFISISAESMKMAKYSHSALMKYRNVVRPPVIQPANAVSTSMDTWIQKWPLWNFNKVTEPKFDGIGKYTGIISNRPDHISSFHFIGIMRNVDDMLKPNYVADILVTVQGTPSFTAPPGPSIRRSEDA